MQLAGDVDCVLVGDPKHHQHVAAELEAAFFHEFLGEQHVPLSTAGMQRPIEPVPTDLAINPQSRKFVQWQLLLQFCRQIGHRVRHAAKIVFFDRREQLERVLC